MDVLYHALSGVAIAKSMGSPDLLAAAAAAIAPDLMGIIPFYSIKFIEATRVPEHTFAQTYAYLLRSNKFAGTWDMAAYRSTHTLYGAAFFSMCMFVFFPHQWLVLSISYISHILIDIPTHEGDFATRILYPLSDVHIRGLNWSTNLKLFLFFWLMLAVIMFLLWQK